MGQLATIKKARNLNTRIIVDNDDTLNMSANSPLRRAATILREADPAICDKVVFLMIRGMMERISLLDKPSVVIGRADHHTGFKPDIDLTPYGARVRGISRAHARLHVHKRHLYVTDLGSDNGTFIAGKRLAPDIPYQLRNGDEMVLGCLTVKMVFP